MAFENLQGNPLQSFYNSFILPKKPQAVIDPNSPTGTIQPTPMQQQQQPEQAGGISTALNNFLNPQQPGQPASNPNTPIQNYIMSLFMGGG